MHRLLQSNIIQDCKLEVQKLTKYCTSPEVILHVQEYVHLYIFTELLGKEKIICCILKSENIFIFLTNFNFPKVLLSY